MLVYIDCVFLKTEASSEFIYFFLQIYVSASEFFTMFIPAFVCICHHLQTISGGEFSIHVTGLYHFAF